jgi:hypothetical protein
MSRLSGLYTAARDPQPSKSGTIIEALIVFLEGVQSLGAALGDVSFVWSGQRYVSVIGPLLGFTAARDRSPPGQERLLKPLIVFLEASGPLAPRWAI